MSDNSPKPVFPSGYEPPGLGHDQYTYDTKADQFNLPQEAQRWAAKSTPRLEICWYCGDELTGKYSDVSVETNSAECTYSPSSMHELEPLAETCEVCDGCGQCLECHGLGCNLCEGSGVCQECAGEGTKSDEIWSGDSYVGGRWENQRDLGISTHSPGWNYSHGNTTTSYKPAAPKPLKPRTWRDYPWSEYRSHEAANSTNVFVRTYGRYRDAQQNYASCPLKRHWGPRGAAGLIPWTLAPDGKVYVLLSHRSWLVENGGTWSSFGGAIDKEDESPIHAAIREAFEEVEGLPAEGTVTTELSRPCHVCGWLYTTFVIKVEPASVRVNRKAGSGWETQGVQWIELDKVRTYNLHPGFAKSWPELHQAIKTAAGLPSPRRAGKTRKTTTKKGK